MNKIVTLFVGNRVLPLWLVVTLLAASGLGAAAGTGMSGKLTGHINVSTTGSGSGSLLVGSPLSETFKHSPNYAVWWPPPTQIPDPTVAWPPTGTTPFTDEQHQNIAFSDGTYETGGPIPTGVINATDHIFKFWVGDADDITKLVLFWKGKLSTTVGTSELAVWNDTAATWTPLKTPLSTADQSLTFTLTTSSTPKVEDVVIGGYVYLVTHARALALTYTDYASVTATYKTIDFKNWLRFRGPEITRRVFEVPLRNIGVHADDQSAFEAAAEITIGDWWVFALPIKNASGADVIAKLTLKVPSDINVYVFGAEEVDDPYARITRAVKIGEEIIKVPVKKVIQLIKIIKVPVIVKKVPVKKAYGYAPYAVAEETEADAIAAAEEQAAETEVIAWEETDLRLISWKFVVAANAAKIDDNDYLYIVVNAHSDGKLGDFKLDGIIEQIPY